MKCKGHSFYIRKYPSLRGNHIPMMECKYCGFKMYGNDVLHEIKYRQQERMKEQK